MTLYIHIQSSFQIFLSINNKSYFAIYNFFGAKQPSHKSLCVNLYVRPNVLSTGRKISLPSSYRSTCSFCNLDDLSARRLASLASSSERKLVGPAQLRLTGALSPPFSAVDLQEGLFHQMKAASRPIYSYHLKHSALDNSIKSTNTYVALDFINK